MILMLISICNRKSAFFIDNKEVFFLQYEEILKLLKKSKDYLSGEELGEKLGVTRTAVWKGISKLKEQGYQIEAVTNKGYRLFGDNDVLNAVELKDGLQTNYMGQTAYFYDEVDSTNNSIKQLAAEGCPEGTIAIAKNQTAGKGRLGRPWSSSKDTGIWMSLLLMPQIQPREAPVLTLLAGLSVCKAVRRFTGLKAEIKWPNDVLIQGKKICGILTEMNAEMEKINYIVLGIGINVNMESFPVEIAKTATSLKIESKTNWKRSILTQYVLSELELYYDCYKKRHDFSAFLEEYKSFCVTLGKNVHVITRDSFDGKAVDITKEGELIVEDEKGNHITVFSGEVSIRTN